VFLLARRNLLSEPLRLLISVAGVALSVFLISFLISMYRGWDDKIGGFIESSNIDVWVARDGTTDFLNAASILPEDTGNGLKPLGNVNAWSPLIVRPMRAFTRDGDGIDISLIGFHTDTGLGRPTSISSGEHLPGKGEAIIDASVAHRYGVAIGDSIVVVGEPLRVVGISDGGNFIFWRAVFVDYAEAQRLLKQEGFATFIVFDLDASADPGKFAAAVKAERPDLQALTRAEFAAATRDRVLGQLLPIISVVIVLAFIVGVAIAGLTIYTATVERTHEWGILKAVGFRDGFLYRVVLIQSLAIGVLGFGVGAGLAYFVGPFAAGFAPQLVLLTTWQDLLAVGLVTLLMSIVAAFVPIRRLGGIDPAHVFRA
jgi:putative ABC transport system permease protein